jgi:two-component system cell cycle sensor histidine kinase/response regulator CckA
MAERDDLERVRRERDALRVRVEQLEGKLKHGTRPEDKLSGFSELIRRVADTIGDGLLVIERGWPVYANDRACEIFGYPQEELLQLSGPPAATPEDLARLDDAIQQARRTRVAPEPFTFWVKRKDGQQRFVRSRCTLAFDGNDVVGCYMLISDITQRRQAEEALRASERFLADVFASIQDGISVLDTDLTILRTNPAMERWYAHAMPLVGKKCHEAYHGLDVPCAICPTRQALETGQSALEAVPKRGPGGAITGWLDLYAFPLLDSQTGRLRGVIEYVRDVTEQRLAERERDRLFATSIDMLCIIGMDGRFRQVNPAFKHTLGWSEVELLGRRWLDLVHPDEQEQAIAAGRQLAAGESVRRSINRMCCKEGGHRCVAWSAFPLLEEELVFTVGRDITDARRQEEERARLEEQLRQVHKMEAIGRLAAGVAHDFNNLLTPIIGFSDMALLEMSSDAPLQPEMQQIFSAATHAQALTQQLLAFGRRQVLQVELLDPNWVVAGAERMLRRLLREDIEFEVQLEPTVGAVRADRGQLIQILLNLALNASDSMPDGGRLAIETGQAELDEAYCQLHPDTTPGRYVVLVVSDSGEGMDAETQARIFEPFFTTKGRGEGTGLGLSVVHGIVKQHGGHIWVYSEQGKGTTFKVYLPMVAEQAKDTAAQRSVGPVAGKGERVLVVEDAAPVRMLARAILEKHGYRVLEAASGEDALAVAGRTEGQIDLLLTDVVMPQMNGRQLYERLLVDRPGIKVLYMSGYTDNVIARRGLLEPGIALLQKPFSVERLTCMVREVLDRRD